MAITTNLDTLKINYLTQAQYDTALANNQINSNELYFTPDSTGTTVLTNTSASVTLTASGSASKWKVVDSFNTLTVGKWLVIIGVEFSSNTADRNVCVLSSTSSTTSTDAWESDDAIAWTKYMSFVRPASGSVTNTIFPVYLDITTNNPTIYIKAYQDSSSSSVTAHASYTAIKIG